MTGCRIELGNSRVQNNNVNVNVQWIKGSCTKFWQGNHLENGRQEGCGTDEIIVSKQRGPVEIRRVGVYGRDYKWERVLRFQNISKRWNSL